MALTGSQQNALNALRSFMNDDNAVYFSLRGAAGTGKTYMVNDFLKSLGSTPVAVMAPTHKATRVIERSTGLTGRTLHSMHGLRPNFNIDNFKLSDITFASVGDVKLGDYRVVCCDEGSQIGNEMHNLNISRAKALGVKMIYIGDPYQLPPINEQGLSLALKSKYFYELTEIVRQKEGNELIVILTALRDDIKHGKQSIFVALNKYGSKPDFDKTIGINAVKGNVDKVLQNYYPNVESVMTTRFTAYHRSTVSLYNSRIRALVFPNVKELLVKGDILTSYKTMLDTNLAPIIVNSDDYEVTDAIVNIDEFRIKSFITTLRNIETNDVKVVNIVDHTDKSFIESYYPTVKYYYSKAANNKDVKTYSINWRKYYAFKDNRLTMVDIPVTNNRGYKDTIQKELDYGYALTTHKLQGTTVKNIIVDVEDFVSDRSTIVFKNRLLYTALSRASDLAIALVK